MGAISGDRQWGYIETPKCASRAILQVLRELYGWREVRNQVAARARNLFTVARDPYARVVSMWWAACVVSTHYKDWVENGESIETMVRWLISRGPEKRDPMSVTLFDTIHVFSKVPEGKAIEIIKFEDLEESFKDLPFYDGRPDVLPIVNRKKQKRKKDDEYLTPEAIELINRWCPKDFDLGYPMWRTE